MSEDDQTVCLSLIWPLLSTLCQVVNTQKGEGGVNGPLTESVCMFEYIKIMVCIYKPIQSILFKPL